jgi:ribosomal protein L11 methylase PrmA
MPNHRIKSSFRDPSGFLFTFEGSLYRQINKSYQNEFDKMIDSGLYQKLVEKELLIPHEEVNVESSQPEKCYKTIKPKLIDFISYPYEWSFNQLKDAALTTLEIQKIAMDYGLTLKDSSAYNVQFLNGKPIFIDTLSFEIYQEGQFWKPYRQFCQHFLSPLALMNHKDIRLNQLLKIYIDGIPLDLTSKLLPAKTKTMFSLLAHIHTHSKKQKDYEGKQVDVKKRKLSKNSFVGVIESLHSAIKKQNISLEKTEWGNYYSDTNYSEVAMNDKKTIILNLIEKIKPKNVWDIGGNVGIFSRISSDKEIFTVCFDIDPVAIEKNYLECKEKNEKYLLPLLLDLTNPSPDIGWQNMERDSFLTRGPADLVFALALIHHLAISNNVPFELISEFFSRNCRNLIIEFVPKTDTQVKRLLSSREDIFSEYDYEHFEKEFEKLFIIIEKKEIKDSERIIYYMQNKKPIN